MAHGETLLNAYQEREFFLREDLKSHQAELRFQRNSENELRTQLSELQVSAWGEVAALKEQVEAERESRLAAENENKLQQFRYHQLLALCRRLGIDEELPPATQLS